MAFGMPDVKGITAQLKDSFDQLMTEVRKINGNLEAILATLRERGGEVE